MNNAAINRLIMLFVWTYVFISLRYVPENGIFASHGNFTLSLLRKHQIFSEKKGYSPRILEPDSIEVVGHRNY
jgi:hypothetical protein